MENKNLEMYAWAKTFLDIYKYVETICSAIDDVVKKQGIYSGFHNSFGSNSTYNTANKILELIERKKKLIKINYLIEDCLSMQSSSDITILTLTYIDLMKSVDVAKHLNISIRTFFRRKNMAISKIAKALKFYEYDNEKLLQLVDGEGWLLNIYNKTLSMLNKSDENQEEIIIQEYKLLKSIIKELNENKKPRYAIL